MQSITRALRNQVKLMMKLRLMAEVESFFEDAKKPSYERDRFQTLKGVYETPWDVRTMRAVDDTKDVVRALLGDIERELMNYLTDLRSPGAAE